MAINGPADLNIECRPLDWNATTDVQRLIDWSIEDGDMIPLSMEGLARHHLSTAAYAEEELAGYGAISVIYSADVVELGGLVVNPDFRRAGIGSVLVKNIVEQTRNELNPSLILAFSNDTSRSLFSRLGGKPLNNLDTLPTEVWKLCHICPRAQAAHSSGKICCERVFDITDIDFVCK